MSRRLKPAHNINEKLNRSNLFKYHEGTRNHLLNLVVLGRLL